MAKDSSRWEAAYKAYKASTPTKTHKVPGFKKAVRKPRERTESMVLMHELQDIKKRTAALKAREREIMQLLRGQRIIKGNYYEKAIVLYALRLEDDCWYVGMTRNIDRRFKHHSKGKGAQWTLLHKPLEIVEVRATELNTDSEASKLEDDMTIEYAMRYGSSRVRGGGYCQAKPHWPDVIVENEAVIITY